MHGYRVQQFSSEARHEVGEGRGAACDETPTVFVINGDALLLQSLEAIIRSAGWQAQTFLSAAAFLTCRRHSAPGCLILDRVLPDSCGLELQERLNRSEVGLSMIFITSDADVPATVRAMKAGAVEVLARPVEDGVLLAAIDEAVGRSRAALEKRSMREALQKDYALLTPREREVMALVVSGRLNKQAAFDLGISQITVKAHRGRIMRKMKARSFVDLVHKAAQLGQGSH